MPFRLYQLLQRQHLRDPLRFTRGALPKNLPLACPLGREAAVVDLTVLFDLAQLHVMDESAASHQQLAVLSLPHLLRTPTFVKSQEPAGRPGTAAPPRLSSWKITMPLPLPLKWLLLSTFTLLELADPYVQALPEYPPRGENQVKIEDANSACRRHYEV